MRLEPQHGQGAVCARLFIEAFAEISLIYGRRSNPGMTFNNLLVAMVIYARADKKQPEVTIREIAKSSGLARTNVERIIGDLVREGLILRNGNKHRSFSFVSNPAWANHPKWEDQTKQIRGIVLRAANELREVWGIVCVALCVF
jgi:predicted HTH transcriptional regulator